MSDSNIILAQEEVGVSPSEREEKVRLDQREKGQQKFFPFFPREKRLGGISQPNLIIFPF